MMSPPVDLTLEIRFEDGFCADGSFARASLI